MIHASAAVLVKVSALLALSAWETDSSLSMRHSASTAEVVQVSAPLALSLKANAIENRKTIKNPAYAGIFYCDSSFLFFSRFLNIVY